MIKTRDDNGKKEKIKIRKGNADKIKFCFLSVLDMMG
jgi:hypothetical protein